MTADVRNERIVSTFDVEFGRHLSELRSRVGMTQSDLAKALSGYRWHQPTVDRVEHGRRPVRASELHPLAAALRTTVGDLLAAVTPRIRVWPRTSVLSPDAHVVLDYLGNRWTQIGLDRWERSDGCMIAPFQFLAQHYGPLVEDGAS